MSELNHDLFVCQCEDIEHQFVVSQFDDESEIYVSVHLARPYSILTRIKIAWNYLFGKPCMYGAFDEVILDEEDQQRLLNILKTKLECNGTE